MENIELRKEAERKRMSWLRNVRHWIELRQDYSYGAESVAKLELLNILNWTDSKKKEDC